MRIANIKLILNNRVQKYNYQAIIGKFLRRALLKTINLLQNRSLLDVEKDYLQMGVKSDNVLQTRCLKGKKYLLEQD